ncbi:MAG TPA: aconitase family protein, partial [Nitrososphaeraceae archaeon]
IGQWKRPELKKGEPNTILTSYNRNFPGRNDGSRETMNFIGSPELVIALALGGRLSFNPLIDQLTAPDGKKFKLTAPGLAPEVPENGFVDIPSEYIPSSSLNGDVEVIIDPKSNRLQKLERFPSWDGNDFVELLILAKVKGKCTTDHISPAGPWLMYRGHLDKISDNLLLGAVNEFRNKEIGRGKNQLNGNLESFPHIAREYKSLHLKWIIIGDENYGEGSSREHAAMTPRYLGCVAVIAKSFARIHETNLKKQGILALTFIQPSDYNLILEDDRLSIYDIKNMREGKPVRCVLRHSNNTYENLLFAHSYDSAQIQWFKAGSALNLMRLKQE